MPDSRLQVEARFLHDFIYVGQAIADDLTADGSAAAMVSFFERELRTPNFVRAMSQRDPSANVTGSRRADHNQWGSWDGWAGYAITALANLGRLDLAVEFARDLAANLDQGPFGQAHRVFGRGEGRAGNMTRPARKDQSYSAVCAGYIADGIIRGLFGFVWHLRYCFENFSVFQEALLPSRTRRVIYCHPARAV